MKVSKKRLLTFFAGVLALALAVGSWAYYSSVSTIDNKAQTKSYGDRTVEEFTPDQVLEPGTEITKAVGVMNTGDYDLVVRIKMDESWSREGNSFINFASKDAGFNTAIKDQNGTVATQVDENDGLVDGDESVMYKNMDLTNWIDGGDGYWYYKELLKPGHYTGELLKSLIFADNADMGKYDTTLYYSTVDKDSPALVSAKAEYEAALAEGNTTRIQAAQTALDNAYNWTTEKPVDTAINFQKSDTAINGAKGGYADADYVLTITSEVCQATEDAVDATWVAVPVPAEVKTAWNW